MTRGKLLRTGKSGKVFGMQRKLGFTLVLYLFSSLAFAETSYQCVGANRTIHVTLKEDILQMIVVLDQEQTVRASVIETVDRESGNRFYFCDTGGFPYRYELGFVVYRNGQASLTLQKGAGAFDCRIQS